MKGPNHDRFRRLTRLFGFALLALIFVAIAWLWFDPQSPGRDPFPSYDASWEAFDADQRARIELDQADDDGGNPPDREEGPSVGFRG
jgi:hypothetical protein